MCVIWGIPYLFIRVAVSELSPPTLVFFRTTVGALILLPFALSRGGLGSVRGKWVPLLFFAAFEVALPWLLLSSAEQHISSALAGLLISAVPLVGVVIATVLGNRDYFRLSTLSGLVVGLAGVVLIVGLDVRASDPISLLEMAGVAVAYAPVAALHWPQTVPSLAVIASIAVLSIVCTALAFLLFFALVAEIGPVRSTVITYVNPAVAAVLGVAVLHESFTLGMGLGFVLVLAGSILATRKAGVPAEAAAIPEPRREEAVS